MIPRQIPCKPKGQTSGGTFMVGHTSPDDLEYVEEDRVPDTGTPSLRCRKVLSDHMRYVANLLEFCLCCGCQVLECRGELLSVRLGS